MSIALGRMGPYLSNGFESILIHFWIGGLLNLCFANLTTIIDRTHDDHRA